MKRLKHPTPPVRFDRTNAESCERLREWYSAEPRDHWNDPEGGTVPVRDALRAMCGDRCAWCEAPLDQGLQSEHYLPRKPFPMLDYLWENILPSCVRCNNAKRAWYPPALLSRNLIDPVLEGVREGEVYRREVVFAEIEDRLIDPSFDDPAVHLRFEPADCTWKDLTAVGRRTIERFFSDRSHNEHMQKVSALAFEHASGSVSEAMIRATLDLVGHETTYRVLLSYWKTFLSTPPPTVPTEATR